MYGEETTAATEPEPEEAGDSERRLGEAAACSRTDRFGYAASVRSFRSQGGKSLLLRVLRSAVEMRTNELSDRTTVSTGNKCSLAK